MSSNGGGATAARSARFLSLTFLLLVAIGELGSRSAFAQSDLPPSFEDSLVTNIASPTAVAFTPDGRLLITTQPGQLFVVQGGTLLAAPALDLSARLCSNIERGLLGVAVDPQFETNRYIYVYYTFNKFGVCETNTSRSPVNRVSRFTLRDNNTVDAAGEKILIDNIHSPNGNHNAGDLHFGKDGYLYITVGDGGRDYAGDSGQAGQNDAARDEFVLLGKILRITRDGDIPPTNPFRGADSARCNATGRTDPGKKCQETFAWGLRNPFRFAFDPNATGTRFFINDVGQNTWEEINLGTAGADYGWNVREGHCAKASSSNCGAPPAGMTNPIFDYNHSTGCSSITGGAFVPNGAWSVDFDAAYLYSDYVCGKIFKLTPDGGGGYASSVFATGLGGSSAVAMTFGPGDDGKQALYYTTYAGGGQVRRISYTGAANRPPVARASANPTSGSSAPLQVSFNGSASSDPDGDALKYEWDFGDATAKSTAANPVHTYQATGTFTAVLRVTDARGASATASVKITVGNTPPQPAILAPAATARYSVGQTITLQGRASDAQDGTLPDAKLTWQVLLHHNTHTHPLLNPTPGNNIVITAPAPEDLAATETSYLEILLTATDSGGLTRTITQDLRPRLVNVTFNTQPANLKLEVNGTTITAPRTLVSWENYLLNVRASTQTDARGQTQYFYSWSDGKAAAHAITTPSAAATFTANFTVVGGPGRGLTGSYFDDLNFANLKTLRIDPVVNFDWGRGIPAGTELTGADTFSVRWSGKVQAPVSGTYTFTTTSDDGVRLWVNNQQLIDNFTNHSVTQNSATINLVAGQVYDVRMDYYENFGDAVARLSWSYPGQTRQTIPQNRLYPDVLLVVQNAALTSSDRSIRSRLENLGYSVIAKTDREALPNDAQGKALVVISSTTNSPDVNDKFRLSAAPVLTWEHALYDDLGVTGTSSADHNIVTGQRRVVISDPTHPLAGGLSGTVTVYTAGGTMPWGRPAANAATVASIEGDNSKAAIFGYEKGALLPGNIPAPARRVGLFLFHTSPSLTGEGGVLFDAAVRWAAGG